MLTRMDDFPRHQVVDTMAHVGTSDPTFSDGYYFCFWDPDGEISVALGLRIYPNVDVMEGYATAMHDGQLQNIRMSRRWSPHYDDLKVGPLSLQILEGLSVRHLSLSAPEFHGGFELEILFEARHSPYEEERRTERLHGRVIRDLIRYWHAGRPSGTLRIGEREFTVAPDHWYCTMDHSWGTRQSVGPNFDPGDLPPVPVLPAGRDGLLRLVALVQMPTYTVFFQTHEDASGRVQAAQGQIEYVDGRLSSIVEVGHEMEYVSGSRLLVRAKCRIVDGEGRSIEMVITPTHTPTSPSALGYAFETPGFGDNRGMGVYRGENWIESDVWYHDGGDIVDPHGQHYPYNGYIGPAAVSDGQVEGMAYFETVVLGSYAPYGFKADGPVPVTVLPIA